MHDRRMTVLLLAALLSAAALGEASAQQQAPVDDTLHRTSPNPMVISGQIQLALEREHDAWHLLTSGPLDPESLRDAQALINDSYVLVRFAVNGVWQAKGRSKFPNPLLPVQEDLMEQVRADLRQCLTELGRAAGPNLESALTHLRSAMDRLQTLTALVY